MFTNRCSLERGFTNGSLTVVMIIQKIRLIRDKLPGTEPSQYTVILKKCG